MYVCAFIQGFYFIYLIIWISLKRLKNGMLSNGSVAIIHKINLTQKFASVDSSVIQVK